LNAEILKKMESIKKKYGNFILINTNFASVNPRVDDTISYYEMCVRVGVVDPNSRFDQEQFFKWCTWEHQNIILLGQVIPALRALPGAPRIIIRPHPSENFDRWHEAWPDSSGVSVIREGDHAAWTAAALMLLHTGCTTGVDATLLGRGR
jgi:surface carbohydrate biosynthesis protein